MSTETEKHIHNICQKIRKLSISEQTRIYKLCKKMNPDMRVKKTSNSSDTKTVDVHIIDCSLKTLHVIEKYLEYLHTGRESDFNLSKFID